MVLRSQVFSLRRAEKERSDAATEIGSDRQSLISLSTSDSMILVCSCRSWRIDTTSWMVVTSHPLKMSPIMVNSRLSHSEHQFLYCHLFPLSRLDNGLLPLCSNSDSLLVKTPLHLPFPHTWIPCNMKPGTQASSTLDRSAMHSRPNIMTICRDDKWMNPYSVCGMILFSMGIY